ncbi:hypothetical protein CHARACLAT_032896 [Characodon lateralis]|uniref:Uncharacterized protein n=1 Tax=Characodon lateralis TaxID=208331 RepID=A0ABU7EPE2_9TELE|nr:hypothetical protein [Characodon lateralis]
MRWREVREGHAVTSPTGGSSAAVRDDQRGGRRLIAACDTRQHHGTYRIKGGGRRNAGRGPHLHDGDGDGDGEGCCCFIVNHWCSPDLLQRVGPVWSLREPAVLMRNHPPSDWDE